MCHSQKYSWYKGNPLNYNPTNMEQTQDIEPIYQETSGFYVFKRKDYLESNSRINGKPFMVTVDYKEAVDIDEPSDFSLASILINHNPAAFSQNGFSDTYFLDFFKEGMENKSIKHISFDLDGVLINSLNVMRQAWEYTMNAVNMSIPFDHYKDHIGIPFNDILNELNIDDSLHSTIFHEYNKISKINEKLIEVYNNTVDSIKLIKNNNIKVSVVTSKSLDRSESILRSKFNKISFDAVITPELVNPGRGKPSPDQLLYACHVVGVDPSYTLYVGDMDVDRMCAKKASCRFIYANWGYGDITSIKDVFFDSITALTDYVISIR